MIISKLRIFMYLQEIWKCNDEDAEIKKKYKIFKV